jgi:hypothetical protein
LEKLGVSVVQGELELALRGVEDVETRHLDVHPNRETVDDLRAST